jgi:hypothetical protein
MRRKQLTAECRVLVAQRGFKKCTICGIEKTLPEFCKTEHSLDGYYPSCKLCKNLSRDNKKANERQRLKRATDPAFVLNCRISRSIRDSFRRKNGRHWELLVGFTLDELKTHLESQFHDGMSWDNMGQWHIDHLLPVSMFKFESETDPEFQMCWDLSNLRPLWAADNIRKHNNPP